MTMRILTVGQAMGYLRELLETDLVLGDVWISGEVSGPRTLPSGHTYFGLKDADSRLQAVLFRATQQRLRGVLDYLTQGSQVIVHGRMTVYEARGELQVVVDFVQPEGVGLHQAQYERLRLQLEEEGLFDPSRKRLLPRFPQRIGVATSQSGAVFHDICNVLRRRWPLAEVVLAPTPVQGEMAPLGVVAAVEALNSRGDIDVIIVARGGGSIEELWAFNEEPVARAVFGSGVPVISAVGHETDYTICDFVADLRAPTPSAAAELVAPDWLQVTAQITAALTFTTGTLEQTIARQDSRVVALADRAARGAVNVERLRQKLDGLERQAFNAFSVQETRRRELLRRCLVQMTALDPQATLNRGYAVVHKAGGVVSSVSSVASGDSLVIKVADGGFPARVEAPARRRRRTSAGTRNGTAKPDSAVQPVLFP
jgi:exodeoxyribonuclease VII large subunit